MARPHVDDAVVALVRAWAAAPFDRAAGVLRQGRLQLSPTLLPLLISEIAVVTAEHLLVSLEKSQSTLAAEEPTVPFLELKLSQAQGRCTALWLEEQRPLASALGLPLESWSKHLQAAFERVLEPLHKARWGDTAVAVAEVLAGNTATSAVSFQGGADPRTNERAGLWGLLAARAFGGKVKGR